MACVVFHVLEDVVVGVGDDEPAAQHVDAPSNRKIPWFVVVWVVHWAVGLCNLCSFEKQAPLHTRIAAGKRKGEKERGRG